MNETHAMKNMTGVLLIVLALMIGVTVLSLMKEIV
jgi:hypothetical protein